MSDLKEHGILFSAPMVRALLAGTKTQTRRIAKAPKGFKIDGPVGLTLHCVENIGGEGEAEYDHRSVEAPHGPVGRRLWVRETWSPYRVRGTSEACSAADATFAMLRDGTHVHRSGKIDPGLSAYSEGAFDGVSWKPSIHMPRWASRITLEVTRVRLERVQAITEDDARAEGVTDGPEPGLINGQRGTIHTFGPDAHRKMYALLWDTINGVGSWASNPWTWAYDFKRIA